MHFDQPSEAISATSAQASPFAAVDIAKILREHAWLQADEFGNDCSLESWFARAAELLGPHAEDETSLSDLLQLIFVYDAAAVLANPANQDALSRTGAREVIRELANRILEGDDIDSDRFKEIIEGMKESVTYRSRAMFHPIRIALTGHVGEGELDRVILLLDSAAKLHFAVPVKSTRQRILEFCSELD